MMRIEENAVMSEPKMPRLTVTDEELERLRKQMGPLSVAIRQFLGDIARAEGRVLAELARALKANS